MLHDDTNELPLQIKGKVRGRITVAVDADEATVAAAALAEPSIVDFLGGSAPRKVIVVPGKIVNIIP
jgi:leucyl-tRNA synthetase